MVYHPRYPRPSCGQRRYLQREAHALGSGSGIPRRSHLDVRTIPTTMPAAMTSEEVIRPNPRPPSAWDLVRVSPSVAPRGRVRTYADQKIMLFGILVRKCARATRASRPANSSEPRSNPTPVVVATKSPSAVPSVFETRMVTQ